MYTALRYIYNVIGNKKKVVLLTSLSFLFSKLRSALFPSRDESPFPNFLLDTIITPF